MKARMQVLKKQHAAKKNHLTNYIFEDPLPAILISLMQLTSAVLVELLNLIVLSG